MNNMTKMQKIGALIIGIIFVGVGIFMFIKDRNLVKNCTEETSATVVDFEEEFQTDDDGSTYMYYPVIEYNVGEQTIKSKMDKGSSTPAYKLNEKITILYNPNKTNEFIVKGDKSLNIFSFVFMGLGVLITGYGVVLLLKKNNE